MLLCLLVSSNGIDDRTSFVMFLQVLISGSLWLAMKGRIFENAEVRQLLLL